MKVYLKTLGCKVNWIDTMQIQAALTTLGHEVVSRVEEADTLLVNSCTVTAEANRKSHQMAQQGVKAGLQVLATGCSVRMDPQWQQLNHPNLHPFSSVESLTRQLGLDEAVLPYPLQGRTRLPITIQKGCDNRCGFCITKLARGDHQSLPATVVLEQIQRAVDEGIQEVILTGVNLAAWGCRDSNRAEESRFSALLEQILTQTTIARIRLSSLGPQYLDRPFFDLYRDPRLCDYLHLSLQSGSAEVLALMERGHGVEEIEWIAEEARRVRPDTALAGDLIAGFAGEREQHHQQTRALIERLQFAKLHIFPYSEREGTAAIRLPDPVPIAERRRRAQELRQVATQLRQQFIQGQIGQSATILVEESGSGLSSHYIRLQPPPELAAVAGQWLDLVITPERLAGEDRLDLR